jgi:hypothetical protein
MGEIYFYKLGSSMTTEEIRHLGGVMYNLTPSFFNKKYQGYVYLSFGHKTLSAPMILCIHKINIAPLLSDL